MTACSRPLPVRAAAEEVVAAVAVAMASSVAARDAVVVAVATVATVARAVVAAKVVASSADAVAVVRDADVARVVAVEAAVVLSPAPTSTSPTPALSPAWARRALRHSVDYKHDSHRARGYIRQVYSGYI